MMPNFLLGLFVSVGFIIVYVGSVRLIINLKNGLITAIIGLVISLISGLFMDDVGVDISLQGWKIGVWAFNVIAILTLLYTFVKLFKSSKKKRKNRSIKNNYPAVVLITIAFCVVVNFSYFIFFGIGNWLERIFNL